jgi:putative transposase
LAHTYRIGRKPSLLTLKLLWSHPKQLKNTKKNWLNHKSKTSIESLVLLKTQYQFQYTLLFCHSYLHLPFNFTPNNSLVPKLELGNEVKDSLSILPQNLQNWKKTFLANAEIAMEPSKAVKEYKEELVKPQKQNERLTALVGKVTVEKGVVGKQAKKLGLI